MTAPLLVLQSFRRPRATTNPYLVQLVSSLPPAVSTCFFSWQQALIGRYAVLHVHWPEHLLRAGGRLRRSVRRVLFAVLLARLSLSRTVVVRTVHNVAPHEKLTRVDALLLAALEARTDWWVRLNASTVTPCPQRTSTVLHGHYRDVLPARAGSPAVPGRLLFFGLIRPYKGVETLVEAFHQIQESQLSLHAVGRVEPHPDAAELLSCLATASERDERVVLRLNHVPDDELAMEIEESTLVVLPYRAMHNSGACLLALSLGRPVLLPQGPVTEALADEVGAEWVLLFDGILTAEVLGSALLSASSPRDAAPDLRARNWAPAGQAHHKAYVTACAERTARRPWRH